MNKIPESCHALKCHVAGQLPVYELVPVREPSENQVVVQIHGAGIGPFQHLLLSGKGGLAQFPFINGAQGTGVVVHTGSNAKHLLGKRVVIGGKFGLWIEYATTDMNAIIEIDEAVSLGSATYGFGTPLTALGLFETVKKQGKKSIVLDAAASSIGKMINKLARKQNIPVLNVVKRKDQQEVLRSDGAEHVIVTEGNWKQSYETLAKELQSDILIDSLGVGDVFDILVRGLIPGGVIVIMGQLQGQSTIVNPFLANRVEADKYTFVGWHMMKWYQSLTPEEIKGIHSVHSERLTNECSTYIAQVFKFTQIEKAIEASKTNQTKGKILLVP